MELETTRFGRITVDPDAVITFTQPIIGFQEYRRFVVLPGPEGGILKWLQSVEKPELAFLMMDPRVVVPEYQVRIGAEEQAELVVTSIADLEIFTLVVVPADKTQIRTNLKAPILINLKHRLGKQTILDRTDYPVQYFLARAQRAAESPQEVADARTDA